jgi:hypothetical protein
VKIIPQRSKPKPQDEDNDVVLVLAPFNKLPKLLFENVKVGTSKLQHIIIRNPSDSRIEVCLLCIYIYSLFNSAFLVTHTI